LRRRLSRLDGRDWRVLDRALVLALLLASQVDVVTRDTRSGPLVLNMVVLAGMSLTLLWRRERPLWATAGVLSGAVLMQAFLTGPPELFSIVLMLVAATYSTGAHLSLRPALLGLAIGAGTILVVALVDDPNDAFFPVAFFGVVPWLVGRTIRNQTRLARELAEKAERAEHERDAEERRAIASERRRVARELHDVLAHDLSVMVVQAAGARRLLAADPDQAATAAEVIERTGREALAEIRQLLGAVRKEQGEPLAGLPGLDRIELLADRAREAGLPVEVRVEGEPVALPTGVDLTAYRVVQEALTNTIKHAGGARARVTVRYEPWEVVVEVEDDGPDPGGHDGLATAGGGHGLVGMRERVGLYGGLLQAGHRRDGGFAVRARLPTVAKPSEEAVT
jgi:signal transduction histidine kinase